MYTFWLNLCFWGLKKNVKYAPCITNNFCGFFSLLPEKFYWVAGGSAGTVVQCTMYIPSCVHSDLYLAWVMSCWGASWSTFWSLYLAWVKSSEGSAGPHSDPYTWHGWWVTRESAGWLNPSLAHSGPYTWHGWWFTGGSAGWLIPIFANSDPYTWHGWWVAGGSAGPYPARH